MPAVGSVERQNRRQIRGTLLPCEEVSSRRREAEAYRQRRRKGSRRSLLAAADDDVGAPVEQPRCRGWQPPPIATRPRSVMSESRQGSSGRAVLSSHRSRRPPRICGRHDESLADFRVEVFPMRNRARRMLARARSLTIADEPVDPAIAAGVRRPSRRSSARRAGAPRAACARDRASATATDSTRRPPRAPRTDVARPRNRRRSDRVARSRPI